MTSWVSSWKHTLGLSAGVPEGIVAVFALAFFFLFVIFPVAAFVGFVERKLSADLQARVGPNRAGWAGALQPVADFFKLLQKKVPEGLSNWERAVVVIYTAVLYSTVAVLPLGSMVLLVDADMSAFLPFWAVFVLAFGTMLMGLNQGTVPGWFGGIRVAALAMAGAFPALLSLVCAGVRAGGFRWTLFASSQGASPIQWSAFGNPFEFVAFLVFLISGLIVLGVAPMDSGNSPQDLHGGFAAHLPGRRLILFRLGRFYGFFLWSLISVVLFLGAWNLPDNLVEALKDAEAFRILQLLEYVVVLAKTVLVMLGITLIARVTPRLRADEVTQLALKVLGPFALAALAGSALWLGRGALL